jgi:TPR repeat protein
MYQRLSVGAMRRAALYCADACRRSWGRFLMARVSALLLAVALTIAVASSAPAADLETGVSAYQKGDYKTALSVFRAEAEKGDARAQYNLGVLYLTGHGVGRDPAQALLWDRRAADQGLAVAQHQLGLLYYRGEGTGQNYAEAAKWFRKAADQGLADAQYNLGVMYFNGDGVEENMAEVVKWISLAAGQGFPEAEYRLGVMYEDGSGLPRDRKQALDWYRRAAKAGNEQAAAKLRALAASEPAHAASGNGKPTDRQPGSNAETAASAAPPAAPNGVPQAATRPSQSAGHPSVTTEPLAPDKVTPPTPPAAQPPVITTPPPERPAPASPPTTPPADITAHWRIQLAAYHSAAEAKAAWARLEARHGAVLRGLAPHYERVDLGPRGVFHRLQAGPIADRGAARALCARIRQAVPDQPCLVIAPRKSG